MRQSVDVELGAVEVGGSEVVVKLELWRRASRGERGTVGGESEMGHTGRLVTAAAQVWGAEQVARARSEVNQHPTRVLANAAVNVAWRNGPVEDIHAGRA